MPWNITRLYYPKPKNKFSLNKLITNESLNKVHSSLHFYSLTIGLPVLAPRVIQRVKSHSFLSFFFKKKLLSEQVLPEVKVATRVIRTIKLYQKPWLYMSIVIHWRGIEWSLLLVFASICEHARASGAFSFASASSDQFSHASSEHFVNFPPSGISLY